MTNNVACSTPGCTNPVIGQCSGYNARCGRFYCAEHSTSYANGAMLCRICAEQNDRDWNAQQQQAEIQRIYDEYLDIAKKIKKPGGCAMFIWANVSIAIGLIIMTSVAPDHIAGNESLCFTIPVLLIVFSIIHFVQRKAMKQVAEIDKQKPGFQAFYQAWEKKRDKEASQIVNGLIIGAVFAGAEEIHRRNTQ